MIKLENSYGSFSKIWGAFKYFNSFVCQPELPKLHPESFCQGPGTICYPLKYSQGITLYNFRWKWHVSIWNWITSVTFNFAELHFRRDWWISEFQKFHQLIRYSPSFNNNPQPGRPAILHQTSSHFQMQKNRMVPRVLIPRQG